MNKLIKNAGRILDYLIGFFAYAAGCSIVFMVLSIFVEVMSRGLLGKSIIGIYEFNEYFMVSMTFLGTAWVLKKSAHVRMEILITRLKPRGQALLNFITFTVAAIVCLVITWFSILTTWDLESRGIERATMLDFPVAVMTATQSVGFLLLFLEFLRQAFRQLKERKISSVEKGEYDQGIS